MNVDFDPDEVIKAAEKVIENIKADIAIKKEFIIDEYRGKTGFLWWRRERTEEEVLSLAKRSFEYEMIDFYCLNQRGICKKVIYAAETAKKYNKNIWLTIDEIEKICLKSG